MYEEDRLTALSMYERMFDETADEQGLVELLVSPTRQAVVLARSYDAKERKLQVMSPSRESESEPEELPSFVFVIDKVAQQAAELGAKLPAVSEDQFSIFDEAAELPEVESEAEEAPAEEESADSPDAPEAEAEAENEAEAEADEDDSGTESNVEETAAAVDAFLADFSVENGELVSAKEEAVEPAEEPEAEAEAQVVEAPAVQTRQKVNVFLLILYIFVAIPVGLVGTGVLLLPTALCLSLAAGCGITGASVIGSCFGSFAVIADTMVVFGAGLICLAMALLLLWMFIWFLVSVIPGFIRGICRLGRKICCKEVAVQ